MGAVEKDPEDPSVCTARFGHAKPLPSAEGTLPPRCVFWVSPLVPSPAARSSPSARDGAREQPRLPPPWLPSQQRCHRAKKQQASCSGVGQREFCSSNYTERISAMQLQQANAFNEAAAQQFPCHLCFLLAKSFPVFPFFFFFFHFNPSRGLRARGDPAPRAGRLPIAARGRLTAGGLPVPEQPPERSSPFPTCASPLEWVPQGTALLRGHPPKQPL